MHQIIFKKACDKLGAVYLGSVPTVGTAEMLIGGMLVRLRIKIEEKDNDHTLYQKLLLEIYQLGFNHGQNDVRDDIKKILKIKD